MPTDTKTGIRTRNKRGSAKYETVSKKWIMEQDRSFRISFPEENRDVYAPELLSIPGAKEEHKIPYNPNNDIPEDQVTFLAVYTIPKSDENLQTVARFGKSHRFDFDSDLAVRAWTATSEGKLLEKMSYAQTTKTLKLPALGGKRGGKVLKPMPFQPAGTEYLLRAKRSFLADEMGLGKTLQVLAGMAVDAQWPWLVIVPANLKINWMKETKFWLRSKRYKGKALRIGMLSNRELKKTPKGLLSRATKAFFADHQIFIVNYDRIEKYAEFLKTVKWRGIVFDESHYLKGMSAHRTRAAHSLVETTNPEYVWMLSGTPLMNNPVDIASQLKVMGRLGDFGGFNNFIRRYCAATSPDATHMSRIAAQAKAALEAEAAGEELVVVSDPLAQQGIQDALVRKLYENMSALNKQLRASCYVRREKSEVLKYMPAKTRSTVPLEITNRKLYQKVEADVCNFLADRAVKDEKFLATLKKMTPQQITEAIREKRDSKYYKSSRAEALVRLNTLRVTAALGKLKAAKEWITDFIANGQKLVVFAHHHVILNELIDEFPTAAHTKGGIDSRNAAVERFQNDPNCRLFIGSLKRDGVGITLTASSATAFLELGWTPAAHDQAEDRVHRIGQESAVTAYYLLGKDTVEIKMAKLIERKRRVVNAVADGDPLHNASQGSILGDLMTDLAGGKETLLAKSSATKAAKKLKVVESEATEEE